MWTFVVLLVSRYVFDVAFWKLQQCVNFLKVIIQKIVDFFWSRENSIFDKVTVMLALLSI